MNKRLTGIIVAIVLAAIGTVALVAFVRNAEERAQAGEELVEVYVVDQPVAAGTPGDQLATRVRVELVPVKVQADGSVDSLQGLAGRVAAVDLVPGEQLVTSRFIERNDFANREAGIVIPDDKVEVTISLDPERAIGGLVRPGETVAVLASFEPFDLEATIVEIDGDEIALPDAVAAEVSGKTPNSTGILLRKVLVTAVQQDPRANTFATSNDEEVNELNTAPAGSLLITLAVDPADAERLIFTQEFGFVWLASERGEVPESASPIRTRADVYDAAPGR